MKKTLNIGRSGSVKVNATHRTALRSIDADGAYTGVRGIDAVSALLDLAADGTYCTRFVAENGQIGFRLTDDGKKEVQK